MIPYFEDISIVSKGTQEKGYILGHRTWILVPVPCAAYIASSVDGFGPEPEISKSFQLVKPTESSANDQRVKFL